MKNLYHRLGALITVTGIFSGARVFAQPATPTVNPSAANGPLDRLKSVGTKSGYAESDGSTLFQIVGVVINGLLMLLGTIFIILIIVAGINWMVAGGDQDKIKKAGDTIRAAIIGLIIVIAAFALWMFVSRVLIGTGGNQQPLDQ